MIAGWFSVVVLNHAIIVHVNFKDTACLFMNNFRDRRGSVDDATKRRRRQQCTNAISRRNPTRIISLARTSYRLQFKFAWSNTVHRWFMEKKKEREREIGRIFLSSVWKSDIGRIIPVVVTRLAQFAQIYTNASLRPTNPFVATSTHVHRFIGIWVDNDWSTGVVVVRSRKFVDFSPTLHQYFRAHIRNSILFYFVVTVVVLLLVTFF